ncbi:germin-like protein 11-1 [Magnolia sinica]|uniref:germin-like protein 11-1 n=1 Tax=Magnolia sinica TaxID=86752 RepID=UPI00265A2F8D|nr:germin-like protein 11-1 [Magnolia sinica]
MKSSVSFIIFLLYSLSINIKTCLSDSGPLQDTCPTSPEVGKPIFINGFPCKNPATIIASDFKTSKLNHAGDIDNFLRSSMNVVTAADFPGLNTLGLSVARTDIAVDGMVPPHSHPRASEMFYVSRGIIIAGFIDSSNRLFQKILREGDVYMFPRGLLHFSVNGGYDLATAFSVLNSQNPGVVHIAGAMFMSDSNMEWLVQRIRNATIGAMPHLIVDN